MKFIHTPTQPDGGGDLLFVAETTAEVVELVKHFRLLNKDDPESLVEIAAIITAGKLEHLDKVRENSLGKHAWYAVETTVKPDFLKPYARLLEQRTGFKGLDDICLDLTKACPDRLCHTHITDTVELRGGTLLVSGFINAQDWNGKAAVDRAFINFEDLVNEDYSTRPPVPEFVQTGNGQYSRNPRYATGYKPALQPSATCEWLFEVLFKWWFDNAASEAQRTMLDNVSALTGESRLARKPWAVNSYGHLYVKDPDGTINYDGKGTMVTAYTWEQFAKLK